MLMGSQITSNLLNSKHLTNRTALSDKISCPICCLPFQGLYRPMICCQNRHTICMKCIQGIIEKSVKQTGNQCLCPICRQRIQLPLQSNQEMKQFIDLINTLNEMYKNVDNWQNRSLSLQRELKLTKQQLTETKKKLQSSENLIELMKMESNELKNRLSKCSYSSSNCEKENIFMSASNQDKKQEKKLPLSNFVDDLANQKYLSLVKRDFSVKQVEYLVMYDMTQLVEVNLSFNNIGDEGVYVLLKEKYMPNLTSLKLSNNQITRLPQLKNIIQLQEFDLCNFAENKSTSSNRIKEISIPNIFEEKWQKLKFFGIQFENDKVWEEQGFIKDFVEKFPKVEKIQLSNAKTKIPKTRCQRIKNALNEKAERSLYKRIQVLARIG